MCFGRFVPGVPFLLRNVFRNTWGPNRPGWSIKKAILRWPRGDRGDKQEQDLEPVVKEQEVGVQTKFALIRVDRQIAQWLGDVDIKQIVFVIG